MSRITGDCSVVTTGVVALHGQAIVRGFAAAILELVTNSFSTNVLLSIAVSLASGN